MDTIHKNKVAPAVLFVFMMGIVSLFADMTYEGARSIYGVYLPLLGASATMIGFISGLGELVGYTLRFATGIIADRTKNYWGMTLLGYGVSLVAIPFLALVPEDGWMLACMLIMLERTGKAIRQPAKNTLLSFASTQIGEGKVFALQEFLDQLGAFSGPLLLFFCLWFKGGESSLEAYALCFAILAIPALITLFWLWKAKRHFPHPEHFEKEQPTETVATPKIFLLFLSAISLFALGFVDFPLITMHVARLEILSASTLPLLYAGAMIVDAFAALFFGWLYDRIQFTALVLSGLLAAFSAIFIFAANSFWTIVIGIILWGIGMGAQESILKAAVVTLTPKSHRSTSFGLFEFCFGLSWFLGSWLIGWLYDVSIVWLIVFSVATQLLALPLYVAIYRKTGKLLKTSTP